MKYITKHLGISSFSLALLVSGLLITFFAPVTASAQFVPCDGVTVPCTECHLLEMGNAILVWLIAVLFVIFGFVAAAAGWGLITAGGNTQALSAAKSKLVNALIGILIVLAAWLLVDTIMRQLLVDGDLSQYSGFGVWSEIECGSMTETFARVTEFPPEDTVTTVTLSPSAGGFCPIGFTMDLSGNCVPQTAPVSAGPGGICPAGYTMNLSGSCEPQTGPILPDAAGNCPPGYTFDPFGSCVFSGGTGPGNLAVNQSMGPIFNPASGGSSMVQPGAQARMQAMLANQFACLQSGFGRPIVINDAIAKAGSSRETNTPGSRHFQGDALDLSTAGMSNSEKIRLFNQAKSCGFSGFGFGNTILHVDLGNRRGWAYGNATYGGQNVQSLKNSI